MLVEITDIGYGTWMWKSTDGLMWTTSLNVGVTLLEVKHKNNVFIGFNKEEYCGCGCGFVYRNTIKYCPNPKYIYIYIYI